MLLRDYDLNLLTVFDTVMTTGSASKAAEVLNVTNAAVSQSLSRLKDAVGEQLFVRDGRGLKPTQYAVAFHRQISPALKELSFALDASRHFEPEISHRHFSLTAMTVFESTIMPFLLDYTRQHAPHVHIDYIASDDSPEVVMHGIVDKQSDLILNSALIEHPEVKQQKLIDEKLVCLCAVDHPRIKQSLSTEDWQREWHGALRGKRAGMYILSSLLREQIPERNIHYLTDSLLSLLATAGTTELLVLSGERMARVWHKRLGLRIFDLPFAVDPLPVYLCWHASRESDPGLVWFRQLVIDAITKEEGRQLLPPPL